MSTRIKRSAITAVSLMTLLAIESAVYCQAPTPSPNPTTREAAATNASGADEKSPKVAASAPAPTPEPDYWHQEYMTGDWGGTRSRWKEKAWSWNSSSLASFKGSHRVGRR
jgi:hypothetical protein